MKDYEEFEESEQDDINKQHKKAGDDLNSRADRDEEIRRMCEEADKNNERQLDFFNELPVIDDEELKAILGNIQNPSESYRLYYSIRNILMNYLPKGKENEVLRNMVNEQKNIFLSQGKHKDSNGFRGGDGRMAFIDSELSVVLDLVKKWAVNGAQTFDIFIAFRELNVEKGYITE